MDKIEHAKALGWTVEKQLDETYSGVLVVYWMLVRPDGTDVWNWGVRTESEAWELFLDNYDKLGVDSG